jgi:hypothetical protein
MTKTRSKARREPGAERRVDGPRAARACARRPQVAVGAHRLVWYLYFSFSMYLRTLGLTFHFLLNARLFPPVSKSPF